MSKPRLLVISTGGTITMVGEAGASGIKPTLTAEDLLTAVPQMAELADVQALTFSSVPGASLTQQQLFRLAQTVDEALSGDTAGAIVIQGTDTIEETSFLLSLLVQSDKPVVVTGAMRGPQAPGADGPANLLAATAVASSADAAGRGVLVVLNDEVHSARYVRKGHTALPSAFCSPGVGPVGLVYEQKVHFHHARPENLIRFPVPPSVRDVALLKASLGDDGRLIQAVGGLGYEALVVEAMGAGHLPDTWVKPLTMLLEKMPIVFACRAPAGPTFTQTYGFAGSEMDLIRHGLIPSGVLDSLKSRLLLGVLVSNGLPVDAVREQFSRFGKSA